MKQYSFEIRILEKSNEDVKVFKTITSPRWYDRVFRTAVAIIWTMEELKYRYRGKED